MPVRTFEVGEARLLDTLTPREKIKLSVSEALAAPPVQLKTTLLVSSVMPSPRTNVGVAAGTQVSASDGLAKAKLSMARGNRGKIWRNIWTYRGDSPAAGYQTKSALYIIFVTPNTLL